jgi:hypothetical protein
MKNWICLAIFGAALIPFLHRPVFFDDSSVIITARAAAEHPLHPYDYRMDLGLPDEPVWKPGEGPAYTHPPMSGWILGGVIRCFGEHMAALHLTMWLFAVGALVVARKIIRELGFAQDVPLWLFAFSPAFFLTSLTFYPHLIYATFYFWAIGLALSLRKQKKASQMLLLGTCLALAALSLDHWPILVILVSLILWQERDKHSIWRPWLVSLIVFVILFGIWNAWEIHVYGRSHFLANLHVRAGGSHPWIAILLPLVFLSGGLPQIGIAWWYMARRSKIALTGFLVLAAGLLLIFAGRSGGFSILQAALLSLEFTTGLVFLASMVWLWRETPEPSGRFVMVWFLIEYVFLQKFLVYPSGHHLLMVALPATLLSVRMVQALDWTPARIRLCGVGIALLTFGMALADQEAARIGPAVANELSGLAPDRYYWGNDFSGLSHHFKAAGWKVLDPRLPIKRGAIVAVPRNFNVQGPPVFLNPHDYRLIGIKAYPLKLPFRTWSISDSAGWYSASWGALPYTLSWGPAETFYVYSRL